MGARHAFKSFNELGLEGLTKQMRFLEKLSNLTGAFPPTSVLKTIINELTIPVFNFSSFPPPLQVFQENKILQKLFENYISPLKYKIHWLFPCLLSDHEMTLLKVNRGCVQVVE